MLQMKPGILRFVTSLHVVCRYGKGWQTWQFDQGDMIPLGAQHLPSCLVASRGYCFDFL